MMYGTRLYPLRVCHTSYGFARGCFYIDTWSTCNRYPYESYEVAFPGCKTGRRRDGRSLNNWLAFGVYKMRTIRRWRQNTHSNSFHFPSSWLTSTRKCRTQRRLRKQKVNNHLIQKARAIFVQSTTPKMRYIAIIATFVAAVSSAAIDWHPDADDLKPCDFNGKLFYMNHWFFSAIWQSVEELLLTKVKVCLSALGKSGVTCSVSLVQGKLVDCVGDLLDSFTKVSRQIFYHH